MCDKKKKYNDEDRKVLMNEQKKVINETHEHLKTLREVLQIRVT